MKRKMSTAQEVRVIEFLELTSGINWDIGSSNFVREDLEWTEPVPLNLPIVEPGIIPRSNKQIPQPQFCESDRFADLGQLVAKWLDFGDEDEENRKADLFQATFKDLARLHPESVTLDHNIDDELPPNFVVVKRVVRRMAY
jgi:hypothetical protein